jgi:hypothetical protein
MESVCIAQPSQPATQSTQHPRVQLHQRATTSKQCPRPDGRRHRPCTHQLEQQLKELKPLRKDGPDARRAREHLPSECRPNPTNRPKPLWYGLTPPRCLLQVQPSRTLRTQLPQPEEEAMCGHSPAGRLDVGCPDHQREPSRRDGNQTGSHVPRPTQSNGSTLRRRGSSGRGRGFSGRLTSSALVRALSTRSVYLSNR